MQQNISILKNLIESRVVFFEEYMGIVQFTKSEFVYRW